MFHKSAFLLRYYCTNINKPYFVTTPIFYVNASPHIGHVYSAVIADCVHRFQNLLGSSSSSGGLFTTGTDEHGIKIQQAAANHKQNVDVYCDNISREYMALFKHMNITYTDFIRTTESRHKLAVQELWNNLKSKEHIYSAKYSGWYCVPDETFLTDSQLKLRSDGQKVSIDSGHPVEWSEEENYMFRLSSFHDDILYWIKQGNRVKPAKFEKILLDWLNTPLNDLSVSRPTSRVHWGIPVPGDDTQTVYVWLDALTNYLTCAGYPSLNQVKYNWPPTLQVIGKDILKFHGIYWPAFLIAAGLEPPAQLLVHSHWTVDGEKMSKSKMNVVDPVDRIKHYSSDGLRYFLLREGVAHSDGNYSDTKVMRILNSELADTLGNLLSRCCAKSLNVNQIFPALDEDSLKGLIALDVTKKLFAQADGVADKSFNHYKSYNFYSVVDTIVALLHTCNNFVETTKPWELKKGKDPKKLETIIGITLEVLRVSGIILQPVIPNIATMLLDKINIPMGNRQWSDLGEFKWSSKNFSQVSKLTDSHAILFRRIIQEKTQLAPDIVKQ